jgi:two-component system heavy metal sensor histidine kinase CusS
MLFLAKSDNALMVPHLEKVDLMAEVRSLFEFYDALTEEKELSIEMARLLVTD